MKELGYNIWTHLHDTSVALATVVAAFAAHGFSEDLLREPTERRAFSRAMKEHNRLREGQLARKIRQTDEEIVYGIVHEEVDRDEEELDYQQTTVAKFDKDKKTVKAKGELAKSISDSFQHNLGVVNSDDIRKFVRRLVRYLHGISKRPTGGIYFIPASGKNQLIHAQKMIAELGFGKLYIERVWDGKMERANVWDNAEQEIGKMLDKAFKRIDKLSSRVKCAENQQEKVEELKGFMDVYVGLLGQQAKADDLSTRFQEAASKVASKIKELQQAAT